MRALLSILVVVLTACSTPAATGENGVDRCSNGIDDDGDNLIDCADLTCRAYAFCLVGDAGLDAGEIDAAPRPDGATCGRPIDLVLVLDVSSSMADELARLEQQAAQIFEALRALDPTTRVSLVVYVDDVLAVSGCAPFAGPTELGIELAAWRSRAPMNRSPASSLANVDCPENALDALATVMASCPRRPEAARIALLVTDDTFAERPTVLSGPFGGGIVVQHTYGEIAASLTTSGLAVLALTRAGMGADCGAGRSANVGQGFHEPYRGMEPLPALSGGRALDLDAWSQSTLDLRAELTTLATAACQ